MIYGVDYLIFYIAQILILVGCFIYFYQTRKITKQMFIDYKQDLLPDTIYKDLKTDCFNNKLYLSNWVFRYYYWGIFIKLFCIGLFIMCGIFVWYIDSGEFVVAQEVICNLINIMMFWILIENPKRTQCLEQKEQEPTIDELLSADEATVINWLRQYKHYRNSTLTKILLHQHKDWQELALYLITPEKNS